MLGKTVLKTLVKGPGAILLFDVSYLVLKIKWLNLQVLPES